MLWSGLSARTAVRDRMWGLLLFAGAAWLSIAWSVLRLAPTDVVAVAGPVLFFGAMCEVVRSLAGMKTWWLNAGMAALFAATGVVVLADQGAAPLSLIAWYLMVRGALDVAVSVMNRGVDRTWSLFLTLGLAQTALGFYAASPLPQPVDPVIVTLGALCMLRAVADLTTSLRLREVAHAHHDVLELSPERRAGVAGYASGLADYPARAAEPSKARHRAAPAESFHDEVVRTTADLDAKIADAGVTGTGAAQHRVPEHLPTVPDTPADVVAPEEVAERPRH